MPFESEFLTLEVSDNVGTIWLDRPEKLNAMNRPFWTDYPRALAELGSDPSVRVVVVAGRGPAFSVGIDLSMFGSLEVTESSDAGAPAARNMAFYRELRELQGTMTAAQTCPKPVIAATHGYCLGGGIDLITACDIRLAAEGTVFGVRETKIGMVADVGTLQRLPRIIAAGHAAELLYSGRDFDAAHAKAIGLVNAVHPDTETLHTAAHELAAEIAANSPLAVQGIKAVMQGTEGKTVAEALDYMALWNTAFIKSNDLAEGVMAQVQKREPDFTGD